MIKRIKRIVVGMLLLGMCSSVAISQSAKPVAKKAVRTQPVAKTENTRYIIDSLELVVGELQRDKNRLDSLYITEKLTSAELRDQVIRIDDYRKKLEANISSFKGENLKLNQSNRILIVFNSLVAVLLLVTLFYFLRRMGKRKPSGSSATAQELAAGGSGPIVFTSFEDKLQHLERLGMLKEKGLLSEEEFLIEKQRVLGK